MTDARLRHIQSLQYTDKAAAESALLDFVRETFPQLDPAAVELRPSAVSLNSFNGHLTLSDGKRLFFKTHVEPDSIVGEYYNSQLLADAGYPIIRPIYASTEYGKQFLIYDLIEWPSVFDLARKIDLTDNIDIAYSLIDLQAASDQTLLQIYLKTLAFQGAEEGAKAPVHQLFYHRLAGARYAAFYLENGESKLPLDKHWIINGRRYVSTLSDLVSRQTVITPDQEGTSIIGHGDAHNGNIFFEEDAQLVYFDPAFAGRHNPLLDLAKPLFHNVFATWMYHPHEYVQDTKSIQETADTIQIEIEETTLGWRKLIFFDNKIDHVLKPLVIELKRRSQLPDNWRLYLKTALFCCPFLTMNLTDANRFPDQVKWLGLAYSVMMGSESEGSERSLLDKALDEIEAEL